MPDLHPTQPDNAGNSQNLQRIPGLIPGQRTYSRKGFCAAYGVGTTTFHHLVKTGQLEVHKVGRRTLIDVTEADRWFRACAKGQR